MPDECAAGYWGRIARLNGEGVDLGMRSDFAVRLRAQTVGSSEEEPNLLTVLAAAGGISTIDMIGAHTIEPIYQFVANRVNAEWRALAALNRSASCKRICPQCIDEDLGFWGFSYWRRSHQAPGIFWCAKHETDLHTLPDGSRGAWQSLPHELAVKSQAVPYRVVTEGMTHPVAARYAELVHELLHRRRPISVFQIVRALSCCTDNTGRRHVWPPELDEVISSPDSQLPPSWLRSFRDDMIRATGTTQYRVHGRPDWCAAACKAPWAILQLAIQHQSIGSALREMSRALPKVWEIEGAIDDELAEMKPKRGVEGGLPLAENARQAVAAAFSGETVAEASERYQITQSRLSKLIFRCLVESLPIRTSSHASTESYQAHASARV
jgi:hypothetical protein